MFQELKTKMYIRIFNKIIAVVGLSLILISPIGLSAEEMTPQQPIQQRSTQQGLTQPQSPQVVTVSQEPTKKDDGMINSLVLVDEGVNQVLDLLEQLTKKSILRQQELPKVRINLNSNGKITKKDAILALESVLSMNGIAIVEMGDSFLKAVPAAGVQTQAPRLLTETSLRSDPSQVIYSKIYKLNYLSTQEGIAAIAAIGTKGVSSQVPLVKSNAILVVDTLTNLQRIERLFAEFDKPLALQEELLFYPMKFVNVADVKTQIDALKKGNLKKYLESTSIEADKNSNQLIVLTHAQNKHIIDKMIEQLDVDVQPLNRSQVFRLKHAEAVEVATLIKAVVKGIPMPKRESGDARAQLLEKLRETSAAKTQAPGTEKSQGQQFSESLTLEPDERSNAIVVYGSPRDLELVRGLIDEIDILLAQVQIEVIIAEVTLKDDQVSGLQAFGLSYNVLATDSKGVATNTGPQGKLKFNGNTPITDQLVTVASIFSGSFNPFAFASLFQIAQSNQNVRILSVPMIVTTHNKEAVVKVVVDQPIIGETITSTTNNNNLNQTTKYLNDIGIVLKVLPRIGPNGIIQMEISQTVKTLLPAVTLATSVETTISAPPISNREAVSYISVKDQEVIVLAGLQQRTTTNVKSKIWLLGCLPIIGDLLFSPTEDTEVTTELIMFIRPHVMKNAEEIREVTCEAMDNNIVSNEEIDYFMEYGHIPGEGYMPPWHCGLGTIQPIFHCGPCEEKVVEERSKKRKHPCRDADDDRSNVSPSLGSGSYNQGATQAKMKTPNMPYRPITGDWY